MNPPPPRATERSLLLARDLRRRFTDGLPAEVGVEAVRCLLNAVGAGVGGSADTSTLALIASSTQSYSSGTAPVLGHSTGLPPAPGAMVNAFAVTQNDFDDAHHKTILHPGASALAGLLAAARPATTGAQALRAFALGCEAALIVAMAISPSHYERGWHSSATCASIASVTTAGLISGLDDEGLSRAIDLACLRMIGLRQAHGTLAKGYQVGRSAANGVTAALTIAGGFRGVVPAILGHHEGFLHAIADQVDGTLRIETTRWHLLDLAYKPYPAGMVCFSGIEAALTAAESTTAETVTSVRLRVAPLVMELAGNLHPTSEPEARVSLPHGVAAALVEKSAGLAQFSERAIKDPLIRHLREMVELVSDKNLPNTSATLEIGTADGVCTWWVDEPLGSPSHPLTNKDLEEKFTRLVSEVAPHAVEPLLQTIRAIPEAENLTEFLEAVGCEKKP